MKDMYAKTNLIFSSYLETFGMLLVEAKMMECKILVVDCEYTHKTVGEYDKIFYFDPFSIDDIEKVIYDRIIFKN